MRGGPPLQGDLEGEPGRDLEVHHQGPDHPLRRPPLRAHSRARPLAARAATLLLLLAPACGSTGGAGAPADQSSPEAPAARTPDEGTIVYHEPRSSTGIDGKTFQPKTFVFATAEEGLAEDVPVRTVSGTVRPGEDPSAVARRLLGGPKASTRLLSPARFSDLWERLAATGVLDLPRHRGKDLPEREDYFIFQSSQGRVVIPRPAVSSPPRPDDPGIARLGVWRNAKLQLFDFLNER